MSKLSIKFMKHSWRPLVLVILFIIMVLILTSTSFPFKQQIHEMKASKPWLNPYLLLASGLLVFLALFYHRSSFFLPLLLFMCLGLNLLWLGSMSRDTHCHLQNLQNNSLSTLLQACPNDLGRLPIYVSLYENYKGRTLHVPAGMLDELGLSSSRILEWGRLDKVELDNYQSNLSSLESARIMGNTHKVIDLAADDTFIFVLGRSDSNSPLLIKRYSKMTFVGPLEILAATGTAL